MIDINGKRILLIGIDFYDYEKSIIKVLEEKGAIVFYFSSYLTDVKCRVFQRMGLRSFARRRKSNIITDRIKSQPSDIDYIIIIKGDNFEKEHILQLKEKYPKSPMLLYLWDSLIRLENKDLLLSSFDNIATFDRIDSITYGLKFRPLFGRNINKVKRQKYDYCISFVGGDHSIRYNLLHKLKNILNDKSLKYKFILSTGKFNLFVNRYIKGVISKDDLDIFSTHQIPYSDFLEISQKSNVILDIAHPLQSGLTMRTIETLCMGKKILTTNKDIINYDFPSSLYRVIDENKIEIPFDFLTTSLREEETWFDTRTFTIESFVEDLLSTFVDTVQTN